MLAVVEEGEELAEELAEELESETRMEVDGMMMLADWRWWRGREEVGVRGRDQPRRAEGDEREAPQHALRGWRENEHARMTGEG